MQQYVPRPYISHAASGGEAAAMGRDAVHPAIFGPHAAAQWSVGYHEQKTADLRVERDDLDPMDDDDIALIEEIDDRIDDHRNLCGDGIATAMQIRARVGQALPKLDVLLAAMPEGLRSTGDWSKRCYEVSAAIRDTGLLAAAEVHGGRFLLCYGTYHGHVDASSPFAGRGTGMSRHGWLETTDGIVLDATRWVFTGEEPSLHVDTIEDYDLGAMRMRMAYRERRPDFDTVDAVDVAASDEVVAMVSGILGDGHMTARRTIGRAQAFWLGTLHLEALGANAAAVYRMLEDSGLAGIVPTDNRSWYMQQIDGSAAA